MVHPLSRPGLPALAVALTLAFAGCNTQRLAVRMMQPTFARMKADFEAEESPRQAREAGPALLAMMDGFLAADPENEKLLLLATEMLAGYAFAFAEEEDPAWARSLNRKALTHGTRLLDLKIEFSAHRDPRKIKGLQAQLARLEKEDVPALFWTGFAYGGLINSSRDDMAAVEQLDVPLAMMNRVIALDPGFHYGGAYLFLGLYHGGRGADIGGKPEEAGKSFRKAIELSGGKFLLARVLYARYYLVGAQKREEFEKTLKEVAAAPPPADRSLVLANAVARDRAAALLAGADRYFGPSKAAKAAEDKTKKEMGDLEEK